MQYLSSVTSSFHLAWHPPGLSMLWQMAGFHPFWRLNNIPFYVYTTFFSSICLLMDIQIVSIFWLLWIMLQWIWEWRYLFEILISIPLDIYPKVGLLDHTVVLFLIFEDPLHYFSLWLHQFTLPLTVRIPFSPHLCQHLSLGLFVLFCFNNSHPYKCDVIFLCGFDLHFPDD